MSILQ